MRSTTLAISKPSLLFPLDYIPYRKTSKTPKYIVLCADEMRVIPCPTPQAMIPIIGDFKKKKKNRSHLIGSKQTLVVIFLEKKVLIMYMFIEISAVRQDISRS